MNWEAGGDRRSLVCVTQVMSEPCCTAQGPLSNSPGRLKWEMRLSFTHGWNSLCCAAEIIPRQCTAAITRMVFFKKRHGKLDRKSKI